MGIVSLLIGLYHVLLLVGPILATYLTISSNSESVTVILLWAFSYLRGLGYDSITDLYSEEASIYISLIAAIKTTHYIDFSQTGGLVAWGIVLCAELSYFALRRVPKVGDFIAIHRYKHIATSGNPLNAPPWKDLGVIVFLAVALNALRAILYATVFTIPSSIDSSALNQYSYSVSQTTYAIDYRGIYTALVELAVWTADRCMENRSRCLFHLYLPASVHSRAALHGEREWKHRASLCHGSHMCSHARGTDLGRGEG
jgi:hypothetical protein